MSTGPISPPTSPGTPHSSTTEKAKNKEILWSFISRLMREYRSELEVIPYTDVDIWSDVTLPKGYSSIEGDMALLDKISPSDKDKILNEFDAYVKQFYIPGTDICPEKMVQLIARFVQETFLYTLGRNANFSEMIEKHCGNCGDKAALFKLMVYLVKEKEEHPKKMKDIIVDIIVQGAKNPKYLGPGGKLFPDAKMDKGTIEKTPNGPIKVSTNHYLSRIRFPSGQTVLLDLSDSSHLSKAYGVVAIQGLPVYPGDISVDKQPNKNPFEELAYLLFLPSEYMGIMKILSQNDYNKSLFRTGEPPTFVIMLFTIQSCLFAMYQGNNFETAKELALAITQKLIDILDKETDSPSFDQNFKLLIDKLSPKDKEAMIKLLDNTITENRGTTVQPEKELTSKILDRILDNWHKRNNMNLISSAVVNRPLLSSKL